MYYLKPPNKSGLSLIYIQFAYHSLRLIYSTSLTIDPKHWDSARKRTKRIFPYSTQFNAILDKYEKAVNQAYYELLLQGVPSIHDLRAKLDSILKPDAHQTVLSYIKSYIAVKAKTGAPTSIRAYNQVQKSVEAYDKRATFDKINMDWLEGYKAFLLNKGYGQNTAAKHFSLFRGILNHATDKGVNTSTKYKTRAVSIGRVETTKIFLDVQELDRWANAPMPNKEKELARDLFVVASFTGVRVSDIPKITRSSFTKINSVPYFKFVPDKTKEAILIPAHPLVIGIMEKYDWQPGTMSQQRYNDHLKEIGQIAKIDNAVVFTSYPGGKKVDTLRPKYTDITSHTARRNLICNMYIAGIPVETIKKISGHKSHEAFMKYLRLTPSDHLEMAYQSAFFKA